MCWGFSPREAATAFRSVRWSANTNCVQLRVGAIVQFCHCRFHRRPVFHFSPESNTSWNFDLKTNMLFCPMTSTVCLPPFTSGDSSTCDAFYDLQSARGARSSGRSRDGPWKRRKHFYSCKWRVSWCVNQRQHLSCFSRDRSEPCPAWNWWTRLR